MLKLPDFTLLLKLSICYTQLQAVNNYNVFRAVNSTAAVLIRTGCLFV